MSLVVVEGGRQAWAKFIYEDYALPDESPLELQDRVNEVTVNGVMDAAEATRAAQRQIIDNEKAARSSNS
jgi:hypothetical protein